MEEFMKVSIIIPTYNVEKYVFRAIESCIAQTYKNIEIIIVDDGSTDSTREIIEEYCLKDKRIKNIYQKNFGVSSARNKGIENAKGDFLIFLDSDDWLEIETIEYLVSQQLKNPKYFVMANFRSVYLDKLLNKQDRKILKTKEERLLSKDILKNFMYSKYRIKSSCYKLFSSKILKKYNIKFNDEIHHGEDGLFVFEYLLLVKKVLYSNKVLWNILERQDSASREKKFNKKLFTAIKAVEKMIQLVSKDKELDTKMKGYLVLRTMEVYFKGNSSNSLKMKEEIYLKKFLYKYRAEFLYNAKLKDKIKFYLILKGSKSLLKNLLILKKYIKGNE